jgi:hypothetical protein
MSLNHTSQAVARGAGAAQHMLDTHGLPYPHSKQGKMNLRKSQALVLHRSARFSVINPASQPSDAMTSGGFTDFRMSAGEPLRALTLDLSWRNENAGPVMVRPEYVFATISHVEVLAENGSQVVERHDSAHFFEQFRNFSKETASLYAGGMIDTPIGATPQSNTQFGAMNVAGAGDSVTSYVPLLGLALVDHEIFLAAVRAPFIIRVWWKAGQHFKLHAPTNPSESMTLDSCRLLAESWQYSPEIRQAMVRKNLSSKLDIRFASPRFQRSSEEIQLADTFNLRLSSVNGLVTSMCVLAKDTATGSRLKFDSVELLDSSGQSVLGGSPVPEGYLRHVVGARAGRFVPNFDWGLQYFIQVPLSGEDAFHHERAGTIGAYLPMSGQHQLSFKLAPVAGQTQQSVEITVLYRSVSTLTLDKGNVRVQHS